MCESREANPREMLTILNNLGAEGWEVIAPPSFIPRPLPDTNSTANVAGHYRAWLKRPKVSERDLQDIMEDFIGLAPVATYQVFEDPENAANWPPTTP